MSVTGGEVTIRDNGQGRSQQRGCGCESLREWEKRERRHWKSQCQYLSDGHHDLVLFDPVAILQHRVTSATHGKAEFSHIPC